MIRPTAKLRTGDVVATTLPFGMNDFGIPMVEPTHRLCRPGPRGLAWREVRSVLREGNGRVVRFTDGTKSRALNGHAGWMEKL